MNIKVELIRRSDAHFAFKIRLPCAIVARLRERTRWDFTRIRLSPDTDASEIVRSLKEERYIPDRWPVHGHYEKEVENPVLMRAFWEQQSDKAIEIFNVLTRHGVAIDVAIPLVEPYLIDTYIVSGPIWNLDKSPRASEHLQSYPLSRELAYLMEKMAIELKKAEASNG